MAGFLSAQYLNMPIKFIDMLRYKGTNTACTFSGPLGNFLFFITKVKRVQLFIFWYTLFEYIFGQPDEASFYLPVKGLGYKHNQIIITTKLQNHSVIL